MREPVFRFPPPSVWHPAQHGSRNRLRCLLPICRLTVCAAIFGTPPLQAADTVAKAREDVRNVKADMFGETSSVLGKLPTPAEYAAAQPDRRREFHTSGAQEYAFTAEQRDAYQRTYAAPQFKGRPRMAECFPVGITGLHVRDITDQVELVVVAVEEGSPAGGVAQVNDIILGANGRLFDDPMDPRPALGYALSNSQTPEFGGKMTLQVVRAGKPLNLTLKLPVLPAYSRTWPDDCERSKLVAAAALRCVLDHQPAAKNLFNIHGKGGFWTPLFLLASGEPEALELVTRWAYYEAHIKFELEGDDPGGNNWIMSYNLVNLCEYYELTGDSSVLPRIRSLAKQIERNQYTNVGTWGHGIPTGYGPINNCGLICFMGLVLAQECGVEVNEAVLARAVRFFGKFCGTNFPYGEGSPGNRSGRMDNGMNATSAIGFHLLGEDEMARRWARSVCYMWMGREKGHAERIFPLAWGPAGASMAPAEEFHMHLNNLLWIYELMRTRDGGFVFTDYGSNKNGTFPYPAGSTAAIGMAYYIPQHRLRVLGAPKGVFAQPPPAGMEQVAELYRQKKWSELKDLLGKAPAGDTPQARCARDFSAAMERLDVHYRFALGLIRKNLQADQATAGEQLRALENLLGRQSPEMAELAAQLPANAGEPKPVTGPPLKAVVKPQFELFNKAK